MLCEIVAGT